MRELTWRRWILPALLFLATTLNYLDRQTLAILAPSLQKELGFDNAQLGLLFSLFYYTYTFAQFAVGPILDRVSLRWFYAGAVLAWSAVSALTGTASGFVGLMVFRLLLGVVEAVNWPAALRMIATAMPPAERPLANGIFTSGTSVGALIAPGLILGISALYGWRWAFVGVGALGLVWFALWAFFSPPSPKAAAPPAGGYASVLRTRAFWLAFCVSILVNPCLYFLLNWLPAYLVQQRGYATAALSGVLTAAYLGLDAGYLGCGALVLALTKLGWRKSSARRAVFLLATALVGLSVFVTRSASPVPLLVIIDCGIGMWIAMYLTMAQEVSSEHVSTAAGLLGGSGSLAGALAMWAVGIVTQRTLSFDIPFAWVAVATMLAAGFGWRITSEIRERR
ncbi:MAG: MFS transporter [Bryobacteraceae bacterium]|nr:MFS transporter [Bryobacteraceae bacterium]